MLTYNAPLYVFKSIRTLRKTKSNTPYELIVVDNSSKWVTKLLVKILYKMEYINKVRFNEKNYLFAAGNNIASNICSEDVTHYLLLNSDIRVNDSEWLDKLIAIHPEEGGISSLGVVLSEPVRADGYCMLIDKWLYDKYQLDEDFAWWWSVTKLQSQVLKEGLDIRAVSEHESLLHHYGGKSGKGYKDAKGMNINIQEVLQWFNDKKNSVKIIESLK